MTAENSTKKRRLPTKSMSMSCGISSMTVGFVGGQEHGAPCSVSSALRQPFLGGVPFYPTIPSSTARRKNLGFHKTRTAGTKVIEPKKLTVIHSARSSPISEQKRI